MKNNNICKRLFPFNSPINTSAIICACAIFISCASSNENRFQSADTRFGDTESINYEYTNKRLAEETREIHYLVNVEIDEPAITEMKFPEIKEIHVRANVRGSAIVSITTDASGKIADYSVVKQAGLGLDDYIDSIMKNAKIKSIMRKGEKSGSIFTVRFVFGEVDK